MERSPKRVEDKNTNAIFDFVFQNAFGLPVIFKNTPTLAQMKANTWGKVSGTNTKVYIKFADATGIVLSGTELT